MKSPALRLVAAVCAALFVSPCFAQTTTSSPVSPVSPPAIGGQPSAAEMQQMMTQMMELGKPGENHKQLAQLAGE